MNHRMIYRMLLAAVVFVLFAASLGLAHTVTIGKGARLGNGPEVQPGTYRLEVIKNQSTTEAAFSRAHADTGDGRVMSGRASPGGSPEMAALSSLRPWVHLGKPPIWEPY